MAAQEKRFHVYSKLSNSQLYTQHVPGGSDMPLIASQVHIKGGAGLASKHIVTPQGVHTEISESEFEALKTNIVFQKHVENKFIVVEAKKFDVEKVVADMGNVSDPSAPLAPADYPDGAEDPAASIKPVTVRKG